MDWHRHTTGSAFERDYSYSRALHDDEWVFVYSRAVVDGDWVFVSGTTGFDYATMTIDDDPAAQMRQTLANVAGALEACGSSLAEVYSYLLIVAHRRRIASIMPVFASAFPGKPTGTLIIAELIEERIHVELEVRARKGWRTPG
jgi:enamine deaminase RidA (YjgF/YER057c/UK114 family)